MMQWDKRAHWCAFRATRRQSAAHIVLSMMLCAASLTAPSAEASTLRLPGLCPGYTLSLDKAVKPTALIVTNGPQVSSKIAGTANDAVPYSARCVRDGSVTTTWKVARIEKMCQNRKFSAVATGKDLAISCK